MSKQKKFALISVSDKSKIVNIANYLVKNNYGLVNQILASIGELQKVQETLDSIIELSKSKTND